MLFDASNVSVRAGLLLPRKVDKLLKKYKGQYKEMFKRLDAKYNRVKSVSFSRKYANRQQFGMWSRFWRVPDRA